MHLADSNWHDLISNTPAFTEISTEKENLPRFAIFASFKMEIL